MELTCHALQATEEDVHKLLGPHGTVWQLTLPRKPEGALARVLQLTAEAGKSAG